MGLKNLEKIKNKEKFMDWFVSQLILASRESKKIENIQKEGEEYTTSIMQHPNNPQLVITPQLKIMVPSQMGISSRKPRIKETPEPIIPSQKQAQPFFQQIQSSVKAAPIIPESLDFESLLEDKTVKTIEAISGENINILKNNINQTIPLSLSNEDIKRKVEDFSQKTKIPLTEDGIFDAKLGNLHITAVLSDIIPSRLLINKTN